MTDPHSTSPSDEIRLPPPRHPNEPERPATIPDDFLWDPELEAWYPSGEPSSGAELVRETLAYLAEVRKKGQVCRLVPLEEVMGSEWVKAWRASLKQPRSSQRTPKKAQQQRDLFANLGDDDVC